jgi:hypothetical protein
MDCSPAMRITRLTTIASTGRLTKRSVNFINATCLVLYSAAHQRSSVVGVGLLAGCTLLFTCTATPLRSLKTPEVTTSSCGLIPESGQVLSQVHLPDPEHAGEGRADRLATPRNPVRLMRVV